MSCAGLTRSLKVRKSARYEGSLPLMETEFLFRVIFAWKSYLQSVKVTRLIKLCYSVKV